MSWLSGLAGRAEELLNKVDQSAASLNTSLASHGSRPTTPTRKVDVVDHPASSSPVTRTKGSASPETVQRSKAPAAPTLQTTTSSDHKPTSKYGSKKDLDAELFEFLNSDSPKPDRRKKLVHSRQSSTGSTRTVDSGLNFTARPYTPADPDNDTSSSLQANLPSVSVVESGGDDNAHNHSPTDRTSGSSTCPSDYEVVDHPANEMTSSVTSTASAPTANAGASNMSTAANDDSALKSLELENNLLKSEVQSLNEEMSALLKRTKRAEADLTAAKKHSEHHESSVSKIEQELRQMRDRETDQMEAMKAKDSQIAVLRVRMEELTNEVQSKTSRLSELEQDRERILRDHTDSSGLHDQALETLKVRLEEVEKERKVEKEATQKSESEFVDRVHKLEAEQQSFSEQIVQLQKRLTEEKARNESMTTQLKQAKTAAETAKQELKDYKDKATRILQSKDKLISSMNNSAASGGNSSDITASISAELEQERNMLRQELQQSASTIESLRMEIQDLETQMQSEHEEAREKAEGLEESLSREKNKSTDLSFELQSRTQELSYVQEQAITHKTALQQQINERDQEIEKLRTQLMSKKLSTASESELEARLHSLTENLIQKQTLVESLSTEKSSLKVQLERSERRCKELERSVEASASTSSTSVYVGGGEEDGVRHRSAVSDFMAESPADPEFTRRVKRAANSIDKFSIRLGIFLRRYPVARVFVIIYMMLLHLWTMIVLLTYQPEMHGAEHSHMPVPSNNQLDIDIPK